MVKEAALIERAHSKNECPTLMESWRDVRSETSDFLQDLADDDNILVIGLAKVTTAIASPIIFAADVVETVRQNLDDRAWARSLRKMNP